MLAKDPVQSMLMSGKPISYLAIKDIPESPKLKDTLLSTSLIKAKVFPSVSTSLEDDSFSFHKLFRDELEDDESIESGVEPVAPIE